MRSSCSAVSPGSGLPSALRSFPSLRSLSRWRSISMNLAYPMSASIAYSTKCVEGSFSEIRLALYGVLRRAPQKQPPGGCASWLMLRYRGSLVQRSGVDHRGALPKEEGRRVEKEPSLTSVYHRRLVIACKSGAQVVEH
jgi:hypothetical protein